MLSQLLFLAILGTASFFFAKRIAVIRRNILSGIDWDGSDRKADRWKTMARVALGQGKMTARPVAGIMHIIVYAGFVIINIEMLEIVIDGLFGTHRIFAFLGGFYNVLIASFEWLAAGVIVACVVFFIRRNGMALARLTSKDLQGWPSLDANIILVAEVVLMFAFLSMNAADAIAQGRGLPHYTAAGSFPISSMLVPLYAGLTDAGVIAVERGMWWAHIVGVLSFLVYVPYSKHFHIILAFPNTYFSNLNAPAAMDNMDAVTKEVQLMMDPSADPFAAAPADAIPPKFGAKDAPDLTWKQLMEAYTCTECGRCTSECPANQTGKLLSPRKIMMSTRDRIEEIGAAREANGGEWKPDGKSLLGDWITEEELWACTSCQACVEACPINISPMGIILDMRRSLIMEDSKSPESITSMFNNIENNGAPWAFPAGDRGNWTKEV
jgi:ferredoxin